jgi:hypothetical protein
MAIDQEIQSKVDAYRGNPQQLMQRYQQNQQLVDLLALQKLKSEKESAAREMQMQMQQQPGTIAQQREAELLDMTKQEMMQQTQGVLQQRQAQQQKNMQQVAQQGLGALAQQGPAPAQRAPQGAPQGQPMPRMAQGGIVSFQPGGAVNSGMIHTPSGLRYSEMSPQQLQALANAGDRLAAEVLAQQYTAPRRAPGADLTVPGRDNRRRGSATSVNIGSAIEGILGGDGTASTGRDKYDSRASAPEIAVDAPTIGQPQIDKAPSLPTADTPPITAQRPALLTTDGIAAIAPPAAPATAQEAISTATAPATPASGSTGGGLPSLGGGGADAAMQRGFATADAYTGRAEKAGRYADMESELRALDAEQYDPRQERRDQLLAFLAGTANTTNFGSTMAGGTLASLNMRKQQQTDRRQRLRDIFDMAERGMTLDATLANGGLDLGRTMYSEAMANQRAALSAAASMRVAELQAEVRRGELEYNRLKDDRGFGLQERELEIQSVRNDVLGRQADAENSTRLLSATLAGLEFVQKQELEVYERVANNSQLPALQEQLFNAQLGSGRAAEAEVTRIEAAIAAEKERVTVQAETIFDKMRGGETRNMLAAQVLELTGTGATMLSPEDIAGIKRLDGEE